MPTLAADLCQRQFQILRAAWPVSGRIAIASLQPLVNLARLTRRAGDPEGAYGEFEAIDRAAHHGGTATIHGTSVSFHGFTAAEGDRSKVSPWLRTLLREDGTRALAAANDWAQAAALAERGDDAPEQLREARQTRIIAHIIHGHIDTALTLIDTSAMTQPWEHAVAGCLRTYTCLTAEQPAADAIATMLTAVQRARQQSNEATTLFRIRLSLTALDLSTAANRNDVDLLCAELIDEAERSTDAYAAREVLGHPTCQTRMTAAQTDALTALVERARLGVGSIPESLRNDLMASVHTAGTALAHALGEAHANRHDGIGNNATIRRHVERA
jgi:hypothetical protein